MMRSLFSAVSGLRNNQTAMDVIGNNISNVNTTGFKASRTLFQDIFSQTLVAASPPTGTLGGRNPQQVGLGVTIGGIALDMTEGSTQSTSNPLDFAISGEGFFVVDMNGVLGRYVTNEDGDTVQAPYSNDSFVFTRAGALTLDADGYLVTQNGHRVVGVLQQFVEVDVESGTGEVTTEMRSILDSAIDWETVMDPDSDLNVTFSQVRISGKGVPVKYLNEAGEVVEETVDLSNYKIDEKGFITAMDEDGKTYTIGRLVLATFPNAAGVEKIGQSYYRQSQNTGAVNINFAGEGRGVLKSGALEMSNVDLANELTNMIITQRSFQANSRVIATSDTMLEELINLKR